MLIFIKLREDKYKKKKRKLDNSWTTETLCFDVLREFENFKPLCANMAAERLGPGVSEIFFLLAQGRARENISPRRECTDVPRNYREDFMGKEVNSREKKGCARDVGLCQVTLSVELALGWANFGLVGS